MAHSCLVALENATHLQRIYQLIVLHVLHCWFIPDTLKSAAMAAVLCHLKRSVISINSTFSDDQAEADIVGYRHVSSVSYGSNSHLSACRSAHFVATAGCWTVSFSALQLHSVVARDLRLGTSWHDFVVVDLRYSPGMNCFERNFQRYDLDFGVQGLTDHRILDFAARLDSKSSTSLD